MPSPAAQRFSTPGHRPPGGFVWIVDDDADMRGLLRDVLESAGHTVRDVPNGYEFVSRLAQESKQLPDIVVLDIRMPGWTGLEVLRWMQENGWQVPILVITADLEERVRDEALALGAAEVLLKPFDLMAFAEDITRRVSS